MTAKETSLAFVERMEKFNATLRFNPDIEELLRLAKTAALIEEHRLRIGYYTPDAPNDDGEHGYRCWPPFDVGNEKVSESLHEAVRAVADKIKEAS
jgi:hypothetical protein